MQIASSWIGLGISFGYRTLHIMVRTTSLRFSESLRPPLGVFQRVLIDRTCRSWALVSQYRWVILFSSTLSVLVASWSIMATLTSGTPARASSISNLITARGFNMDGHGLRYRVFRIMILCCLTTHMPTLVSG